MKLINVTYLVLSFLILVSCQKENTVSILPASTFKSDVAVEWIDLQRVLVQYTPGYTSPVAARAYAYATLAMYESVVVGIKENKSYSGLITDYTGQGMPVIEKDKDYHWELVVNACMAATLKAQFKTAPADKIILIDQLEQKFLDRNDTVENELRDRSIEYGKKVASAIHDYSKADGQDEAYLNNYPAYAIPSGPGYWVPTDLNQQTPLQAYWGNVRPFLKSNSSDELVSWNKPAVYSTDKKSEFYAQALELYALNNGITLSPQYSYWDAPAGSSPTPAGRSLEIAITILNNENANLAKSAEVFSKVGLAVHDAFVSCWKSKFNYNLLRPETYINDIMKINFNPPAKSLPIPSFPNEHSVQIAAAMEVLSAHFGYRYEFTGPKFPGNSGMPGTCESLYALADEVAWTRTYGGNQYRQDLSLGIRQGLRIGENINKIELSK
jgi:hypothetical protein